MSVPACSAMALARARLPFAMRGPSGGFCTMRDRAASVVGEAGGGPLEAGKVSRQWPGGHST